MSHLPVLTGSIRSGFGSLSILTRSSSFISRSRRDRNPNTPLGKQACSSHSQTLPPCPPPHAPWSTLLCHFRILVSCLITTSIELPPLHGSLVHRISIMVHYLRHFLFPCKLFSPPILNFVMIHIPISRLHKNA